MTGKFETRFQSTLDNRQWFGLVDIKYGREKQKVKPFLKSYQNFVKSDDLFDCCSLPFSEAYVGVINDLKALCFLNH